MLNKSITLVATYHFEKLQLFIYIQKLLEIANCGNTQNVMGKFKKKDSLPNPAASK
jgi:hypothetical protein